MLKEIKNMNTDISSKFSIIEQKSNRNAYEISRQIKNSIKLKEKKVQKINLITNNKNNERSNNLKYNITNENNKNSNNNINNFSINCQIKNNDISNRKSIGKKYLSSQKLLKSDYTKNNNKRRFKPKENKNPTILARILLSHGKSQKKTL